MNKELVLKTQLTLNRNARCVSALITQYSINVTCNEVGTVWRCIDDNQQPFEIICFAATPNVVTIYSVTP